MSDSRKHLEDRKLGKILINLFIGVFFFVGFVSNLPASTTRDALVSATRTVANATYLSERWAMFSGKSKRMGSSVLEYKVDMADGTVIQESVAPTGPQWHLGVTKTYPWKVYASRLAKDKTNKQRNRYAAWMVDELRKSGYQPVRFSLIVTRESASVPDPWRKKNKKTGPKVIFTKNVKGRG